VWFNRIKKGKTTEVGKKTKKQTKKKTVTARKKRNPLTKQDFEHYKHLLLEKRREIIGSVNEIQDETLNKSRMDASGDLSSMPIHMADIGSDNYEQEFALELMDSERKILRQIDEALMRIEEKTYGICLGSGKPIARARLQAKPWAKYSVEYARKIEEGLAPEIEQ